MLRWVRFILFGCILFVGNHAWADCYGISAGNAAVDLVVHEPNVVYDYSKSTGEIASIGSDSVHADGVPLGLTRTRFWEKVEGNFKVYTVNGGFCAILTSVTVNIGYLPIEVYVSNKYPDGSCQKNVILEHENTHVAFALDSFRKYLPAFKYITDEIAAQMQPQFALDGKSATNMILEKFGTGVKSISAKMSAEKTSLDSTIDNPTSYRATSLRCSNW